MESNTSTLTITALSTIPDNLVWIITAIVAAAIIISLFLIFKNFRALIYGGVVSGVLFGIYKLSKWIGVSGAINNDYSPLITFAYIFGFIIISIIVGSILMKFKFIKDFEENMKEDKKEMI